MVSRPFRPKKGSLEEVVWERVSESALSRTVSPIGPGHDKSAAFYRNRPARVISATGLALNYVSCESERPRTGRKSSSKFATSPASPGKSSCPADRLNRSNLSLPLSAGGPGGAGLTVTTIEGLDSRLLCVRPRRIWRGGAPVLNLFVPDCFSFTGYFANRAMPLSMPMAMRKP